MKLILVSNRLPITVKHKNGKYSAAMSVGGLTTAISALKKDNTNEFYWVGWPGLEIKREDKGKISNYLERKYKAFPVYLDKREVSRFYKGFCNKIIWPLFHYFPDLCVFREKYWRSYVAINNKFASQIEKIYAPGDTVFIQDYHLMLLPSILRKKIPGVQIGFFLHIPFPDYEIFRILPSGWRSGILEGLLGADLLGFHTAEYTNYFFHNVRRILGYENKFNTVHYNERLIKAETYPLGIDFQSFHQAYLEKRVQKESKNLEKVLVDKKLIISVDRLDYTKGILNRLEGFELFLKENPEYYGLVVLVVVAVPSRSEIGEYRKMKKKIEGKVGAINGKFGSLGWTPVIYQYKALNQDELKALYLRGDIALITPLRDGMNLIAKEYIATRNESDGVLVLSEMAGAAKELQEAVIINPHSKEEIAQAIKTALKMPMAEQRRRNIIMQQRLSKFDVEWWFTTFYDNLNEIRELQMKIPNILRSVKAKKELTALYRSAKRRLLLFDYDGTLVPFAPTPMLAKPDSELINKLKRFANSKNDVVLISGRDRDNMDDWFAGHGLYLAAEHGAFIKKDKGEWVATGNLNDNWKPLVMPVLEEYGKKLKHSFIEEKSFSLAWHYRRSDLDTAESVAKDLIDELNYLIANMDIHVMQGSKVVEVKNTGVNKGVAAAKLTEEKKYDFILCIGDDVTDEDMFAALPPHAFTIKVGESPTQAKYRLKNHSEVIKLLEQLNN